MTNAVLQVFGCCGRYRGTVIINLGPVMGLVTIEAFGPSAAQARTAVLDLCHACSIPGFDPAQIRERHHAQ